ncbi:MAG: OmpA family protein [Paludibacteraceae bacterium]
MKKLFLSVLLIASAVTFTSAQSAAVGTSPEASKWSIALKGGGTYFRIAPAVPVPPYMDNVSWGAGLIIERTANPLFGMGLDVSYLNFKTANSGVGKTIDPTLFGSFNLSNLMFPHRASANANVYAKLGAGAAFFSNNTPNPVHNGADISPVFTAALHPEVALGSAVALGLEWGYRYYTKEILGGRGSSTRGDDAMTLMATLRFNLGANHVRNMTMDEFYPPLPPVIKQVENPYDDSQIINRLDNIDKQNQDVQNRLSKLEQDVKDLQNKPSGSVSASFSNIEFKFDSSELTEASYPTLNQIATILKDNPTWGTLKVKGHTDSTGPESYNQVLSERRAQSVKDYLVKQGVSESVVSTEGYGETQPIATNDTAEGRQANRRVEFEVIK